MNWTPVIILVFILWGAFIAYKYRQARIDASDIFKARKDEDPLIGRFDEDQFAKIYQRAMGPRGPLYFFAAALTALISLPIIFLAASWAFNLIWNLAGRAADLDEGLLPWMLLMVFPCLAGVAAVSYVFSRAYHQNRPRSLEKELQRELEMKA